MWCRRRPRRVSEAAVKAPTLPTVNTVMHQASTRNLNPNLRDAEGHHGRRARPPLDLHTCVPRCQSPLTATIVACNRARACPTLLSFKVGPPRCAAFAKVNRIDLPTNSRPHRPSTSRVGEKVGAPTLGREIGPLQPEVWPYHRRSITRNCCVLRDTEAA
jgi:hypothetical protein